MQRTEHSNSIDYVIYLTFAVVYTIHHPYRHLVDNFVTLLLAAKAERDNGWRWSGTRSGRVVSPTQSDTALPRTGNNHWEFLPVQVQII